MKSYNHGTKKKKEVWKKKKQITKTCVFVSSCYGGYRCPWEFRGVQIKTQIKKIEKKK